MKKKKCPKCGEVKPVDRFNKNKNKKDGLDYWCKECAKAAAKKRYDANPERVKAQQKKYRDANPERIKARYKKRQEENPERVWAKNTLANHRRKGYEIQITNDELTEIAKQVKTCPICGCELAWGLKNKSGKQGPQPNSPSLDRINNGQIISKDTVQIICFRCNTAKQRGSLGELVDWCKTVFKKNQKIKKRKGNRVLAVDPGIAGALAVLYDKKITTIYDMPVTKLAIKKKLPSGNFAKRSNYDAEEILKIIKNENPNIVVVEDLAIIAGGTSLLTVRSLSLFKGLISGLCLAKGIDCIFISPREWKKHFGLSKDKQKSIDLAKKKHPETIKWLKLKKHHDRAEAILLAEYWKQVNEKTET